MSINIAEFNKFNELLTKNRDDYHPYYIQLVKGGKDPFEGKQWKSKTSNEGHTYKDAIKWMSEGYNTGIVATDRDPLVIIDIDQENVITDIKPTSRVRSRKRIGNHNFYFTNDFDAKVVIPSGESGEVRSRWAYVVAAGSFVKPDFDKHPEDKEIYDSLPAHQQLQFGMYTVDNDLPLSEITFNEFPVIFKERYQKEKESKAKNKISDVEFEKFVNNADKSDWSALYSVTIEQLIGSHKESERFPSQLHGSSTDANSSIIGGLHNCWRHYVTHNPLQYLAVKAGILTCEDAGNGHNGRSYSQLNRQDGKTLFKIWEYAKRHGLIPKEDVPPSEAVKWFALENKIIEAKDIQDGKLGAKYYESLKKIKELGLISGVCDSCCKNKPIDGGHICQECEDRNEKFKNKANSNSNKKDKEDEKEPTPEVNSIDDIPLPQEDIIDPISFNGLPDYNFVKIFVDYIATVSDTYPEYAFINGIAALSTTVRRRLYLKLNGQFVYTNLWTLCLGQSGYARKSAAMSPAYNILEDVIGETFISKDIGSPEGLISELADLVTLRNPKEDDEPIAENQNGEIRKALCSFWKDEGGQFYAQLNKNHMQSAKELLCHLYDCPSSYDKILSNKKYHMDEIYFPMNLATTPTSFINNVTTDDVHTGFLARHNIVNPSYKKERKSITEDSDVDIARETEIKDLIKTIDDVLPDEAIRVRIGKEELKILDDWCKEREEYFANERNETMGSFFARMQINVIKMATLLDLGNLPYYAYLYKIVGDNKYSENTIIIRPHEIISKMTTSLTQTHVYTNEKLSLTKYSFISDYNISNIGISIGNLLYVMNLYDTVFLPYSYQVCLHGKVAIFTNYISAIYKILQDKKKIDRANLMRLSNVSRRDDFDEAIATLKEANAVVEYKVKGKTKPISAYVYVPSPYTKLKFSPIPETIPKDNSFIELTKKTHIIGKSMVLVDYEFYVLGFIVEKNSISIAAISKTNNGSGLQNTNYLLENYKLTIINLHNDSKKMMCPVAVNGWYSAKLPEITELQEVYVSDLTTFTPIVKEVTPDDIKVWKDTKLKLMTLKEIQSNPSKIRPKKTNTGAGYPDKLDLKRCEVRIVKTRTEYSSSKGGSYYQYVVVDASLSDADRQNVMDGQGKIIKYGGVAVYTTKEIYTKLNLDIGSVIEVIGTAMIKNNNLSINAVSIVPIVANEKKEPVKQEVNIKSQTISIPTISTLDLGAI